MAFGTGSDDATGTFKLMVPVMVDPGLPKDQPPKSLRPFLLVTSVVETVVGIGAVLCHVEGMGCRSHADDGATTLEIVIDFFHLFVGQVPEPGGNHHEFCIPQSLKAGNILLLVGGDLT